MKLFNILPGFTRTPPGRERVLLRRLPRVLWIGTLVLCLPSLATRLLALESADAERLLMTVDIYAASLVVLHWTVVFTVAIAAFIVMVMKGPAYVADAYPLEEADLPDDAGGRRR